MRNLQYYNENPFNDRHISVSEIMSFGTDNFQRMTVNNPGGIFTARIAATNLTLTALVNGCADDEGKLTLRMAKKQMKKAFRAALGGQIGKLQGTVTGVYGLNAPEVTEIFGTGRSAFSECKDDMLEGKLINLVARLTARVADLGAPLVADGQALLDGWNAVYVASESSSGNKILSEMERRAAKVALQEDLFKNLLTITLNYPNDPAKVTLYMTQSLLENQTAGAVPEQAEIANVVSSDPGVVFVTATASRATVIEYWIKGPGAADYTKVGEGAPGVETVLSGLTSGENSLKAIGVNGAGAGPESEAMDVTVV